MEVAFWVSFLFIFYTYLGYPLLIWFMAVLRRRPPMRAITDEDLPSVSIIIAVHNEQGRVLRKIENIRALEYPADRLGMVFVSDGSTDKTNEILAAQSDVTLVQYPQRHGKQFALNEAIKHVDAQVVVFADVRQLIDKHALKHLMQSLLQSGVGAVSGELVHLQPGTQAAAQIGLYWRYEKWIRKSESAWGSTVGATGALLAMYRKDFTPLAVDTILDDFEQPMLVIRANKLVKLDARAIMFDELQTEVSGERKRKVRTLTGNFQSFVRHPWLFSPLHNPVWLQFVSHKVFRLLAPYALAVLLVGALLSDLVLYQLAGLAQIVFYSLPLFGKLIPPLRRTRVVSLVQVFVEMNGAAVVAMFNWLTGRVSARWEKT
jgi:poly-beta-1,6-N-acetyl-D-glucosamine synthase